MLGNDRDPIQAADVADRRSSSSGLERWLSQELQELGLPPYQARVLLALLWAGPATSKTLAAMSGIPRTSIYPVMGALIELGLARRLPGDGPAVWTCRGPDAVVDVLEAAGQEDLRQHLARTGRLRRALTDAIPNDGERRLASRGPRPELTAREKLVLHRIRRLSEGREAGRVEAGMIGSLGTCRSLADKGYITIGLARVGAQGGLYYNYRVKD